MMIRIACSRLWSPKHVAHDNLSEIKEMKKVPAWGNEEPSRFNTTFGESIICCDDWHMHDNHPASAATTLHTPECQAILTSAR